MQEVRSVRDADLGGKRVLLRVDFNVPLDNGQVRDDVRIKAALPTLKLLQEKGAAKIILLMHLGRPEGKVVEGLRVGPVEKRLRELIDLPNLEVHENLRFDPREEANDEGFAKELAMLGDVYVDDAFADAHRAHASIVGIPKFLPAYAGLLMESELEHLTPALTPPQGSVAIVGGAKFETKIPLLTKLIESYDAVLLGGALANDMLKSRGSPVGASLVSSEPVPENLAGDEKILIPFDTAVKGESGTKRITMNNDVRMDEQILDIGPKTAHVWSEKVLRTPFVVWNGPVGKYEDGFVEGTDALAQAISQSACKAVIGGGDTAAALAKISFDASRVFLSTGGGAMLEFLAQGTLPGIEALQNSAH